MRIRNGAALVVACLLSLLAVGELSGQGVTTSAITGVVTDARGNPVAAATVVAVHVPSGTTYQGVTRADGRFTLPGMRIGGPYRVTVSHLGFRQQQRDNVFLNLGVATDLNFTLQETAIELAGLTVTAEAGVFSSERTGAATSVTREAIQALPTISRRIEDFARLTPQYSGGPFGNSFAGQDNRVNNISVDGSYFNNRFGLGGQPGDRTGVAPISLDAIEQVQVNIAPYDVRHGNFVGAGVNTVTRSGTNTLQGSLFYRFRNEDFVGKEAQGATFDPGEFDFTEFGGWLSGPIIENKLFFFASFDRESTKRPGNTWVAARDGATSSTNVTRVRAATLDSLSAFLRDNFGYETGPYEKYTFETPGTRFLAKLDYNLDDRNKLSLRYTHLDSSDDVLLSTSSSLGRGRSRDENFLHFANSNYKILENIRSIVGEWNATIGDNKANDLIIGYSYHDESREPVGQLFPFVDIREGGRPFTSFGFEPFTPNNELRYSTFQIQNNFSIFGDRHTWTFGATLERYKSENVFYPGSQSIYVYESLEDFYTDARDYLANPNRTTSPVTLSRFQVRWMNIPGMEKPLQPLKVWYPGAYVQDAIQINDRLRITAGVRVDVPFFENTAYANSDADNLTFRDEKGNSVRYPTGELPDPKLLFSPRFGFNYDVFGDRTTQIRGGTGIFTGPPPYVWISNQIGNTGVLTGFEQIDNTTNRPFHPDPNHYKPTNVTGAPASSYELALTDPDFKFPQVWRSSLALDQRLPFGFIGTVEGLYSRDVNGIYYINANLPAPSATVRDGSHERPRWTDSCPDPGLQTRIHCHVANAIVLKNQSEGYSWMISASLEKAFSSGLFLKAAYSYGEAKNTVDPGSIAAGSWTGNQHPGDPNNPGLGYSSASPGHRVFLAGSYRKDWLPFGATTISFFGEGRNAGLASYTYAGDVNGDGTSGNDLIYVPRDISEMNFEEYTQPASGSTPARTFTAAEQAEAWERYIRQDPHLSKRRGKVAERNGVRLPMFFRLDLAFEQELFTNIAGRRNGLTFRADILNFTNLLNNNWGVAKRLITTQPLTNVRVDDDGRLVYRLRNHNPTGQQHELITKSFDYTAVSTNDVYRIMFSLRYTFQ